MTDESVGSELGTKDYWEKSYNVEIRNYDHNGDVGDIWFEDVDQDRVTRWICEVGALPHDVRIIDLGCGNGMSLIELANEDYSNLFGIDFSPNGITLASKIAKDKDMNITYQVKDLTNVESCKEMGTFGVVLDKGTLDAICLSPEDATNKCHSYMESVYNLMDEQSFYIITSCNFTEDELLTLFANKFVKHVTIPTPTFKFAGKVGSVVSTVIFKKLIAK